jgi:hypothetical protein
MEERFGPLFDSPDIIRVRPHLPTDDEERQRYGELSDPVAMTFLDKVVDQPVG